ncbi:hypothetical protein Acid345_3128 [Candidatus Koribacter versatilis Ellin345]|uniref:Glycosyltransferase RgtA/B/C/D-like domain-containing protein n=1 Tax=Koribacter versatilis (strain Ellin345) TaxID=204669 RepID=Q1ILX1_KORVE|nr:hypothetical protein [Candidatus Koribacter versatilis]ABF42129.1 hypothetical protein Acid345_3128 [Candidatus Koribacter versatilis Ellin345]
MGSDDRLSRYTKLFLGLGFLLALFGLCSGAIASADTWWHLATGRWILANHAVPRTDPFSFSAAGKPWVAHEYLTDILLYELYRFGGFIAMGVANSLVLTAAFAIIAHAARSSRWLAYAAALFAAFASRPAFAIRPQSFSLLFGAAFIWIIREGIARKRPRWFLGLPCLMLVWVQLHAGYLLGIGVIVILLIAELLDFAVKRSEGHPRQWLLPLLGAGAACIAVVPLNPNGFTMLTFPFFVMRLKITQDLTEWQPANLHDPHLYPFLALAAITLIALLTSKSKYRPGQFFLYFGLLAAALKTARNIPIFCLFAALMLADHLWTPSQWTLAPKYRVAMAGIVLVAGGVYCAEAASAGLAFQALAEKNLYPRDAANFIASHHLPANLLNDYSYGGYLIWRLYPEYPVYVDGRADLYGDKFLDEYVDLYYGRAEPSPFLDRNHINTVFLSPGSALATLMRLLCVRGPWQIVYEDPHAVIFVREQIH